MDKEYEELQQAFEVTVARYDDAKLERDKLELKNLKLEIANRKLTNALEVTYNDLSGCDFSTLSIETLMGMANILHNINKALGKEE